jgi:thymidylate synthase (FAD)
MNVKLISFTVPCTDDLPLDSDVLDLIAYCARVSNPSNQQNTDTSDKLIKYLVKHKHWSPFEMANATLEIETTRDIARQILRHRSFTFQEFSQRYADPVKELTFETREARLQDQKNRQNSIETDDTQLQEMWDKMQWDLIEKTKGVYNWAISQGIAKEVARAVLPEGLTMSRMYVNGTIRSWIHYIEIRSHEATQKEHREIAVACAEAISKIFPLINNFTHK